MKEWSGFQKGINLGGWLSQCNKKREHYDTFITKDDIKKIASWGMDHIRLPIDYELLQNEAGILQEENFVYIDNCISWCKEFNINIIFDLHKTHGYFFETGEIDGGFFHNEKIIVMFLNIWIALAKRYGSYSDNIAFSLMNLKIDKSDFHAWMNIAKSAISIIRVFAPKTKIIVASHSYSSVTAIPDIENFYDANIIYGFRCYEPYLFTHQGAYWAEELLKTVKLNYPVSKKQYINKFAEKDEYFRHSTKLSNVDNFGENYFDTLFEKAVEFAESRNTMIYCEEYGVINNADKESTITWFKDIHKAFVKFNIGRAAWTYKDLDFGITNKSEYFDEIKDYL